MFLNYKRIIYTVAFVPLYMVYKICLSAGGGANIRYASLEVGGTKMNMGVLSEQGDFKNRLHIIATLLRDRSSMYGAYLITR